MSWREWIAVLVLSAPVVALDEVLKLVSRGEFRSTPVGRIMWWGGKLLGRYGSFGNFKRKAFPSSPGHNTKESREH
jgi:hypothetical protein